VHDVSNRIIGATAGAVVIDHLVAGLEQLPEILWSVLNHDQTTVDERIPLRSSGRSAPAARGAQPAGNVAA